MGPWRLFEADCKYRRRDIVRSLSRKEKDEQSISSTASRKSHHMQVAMNSQPANFRVRRKLRALNLCGPTLTVKLSENKTRAKVSGSTVCHENMLIAIQNQVVP